MCKGHDIIFLAGESNFDAASFGDWVKWNDGN